MIFLSLVVFKYSPLWIFLIVGLSALLVYWYYFRAKNLSDLTVFQRSSLKTIRFVVFILMGILLLQPFTQFKKRTRKKPKIIVALDQSSSIITGKDSAFYFSQFPTQLNSFTNSLAKQYDIHSIGFGSELSDTINFSFSQTTSDIGQLFSLFENRFFNENIGALVVASDGKFNRGAVFENLVANRNFPVYTIGLGDTTVQNDLWISDIEVNTPVFQHRNFPILVSIQGNGFQGAELELSISSDGKKIATKKVPISQQHYFNREAFYLSEEKAGVKHYTIQIEPQNKEWNTENNKKEVFVNVVDEKQKILILHSGIHPDIAAMRTCLQKDPVYHIAVESSASFSGQISDFDLVVFYQLPSVKDGVQSLIKLVREKNIPSLYIMGEKSGIQALAAISPTLAIEQRQALFNDALALPNITFSLFKTETENPIWKQFPPLHSPHGNYPGTGVSNTFLYQKIGAVETQKPLVWFSDDNGYKTGVIAGEGFWRWKLKEYQLSENTKVFDDWFTKSVQYLMSGNKKQPFLITHQMVTTGAGIIFNARLYNEANELVNDPDIEFSIIDSEGNIFPYSFNRNGSEYDLRIGVLAPGAYRYKGTTKLGDKDYTSEGNFVVENINIENDGLPANHTALRFAAGNTGGKFILLHQMDSLAQELVNKNIKPQWQVERTNKSLLDNFWLLLVILLLCVAEWFLRKYWGQL